MSAIQRFSLLLALVSMAATAQAQSGVQVSTQEGMISVQASNVSASDLAAELSEELGISVVVTGDTEAQVNLDIVDEPLEVALGKISPNHMLVRSSAASDITEVVLMMGEGQDGTGGSGVDQFLPSGSPADEIIDDQAVPDGIDSLTDNAARVRTSSESDLPAPQVPPVIGDDGQILIDPATGLPYEQ